MLQRDVQFAAAAITDFY